ncbi:MAG: ABC transporter permease [Thermoanaerobaculia bacterium]
MLGYVIRRLAYAAITFWGITLVVFVMIHAAPGDPVSFYLGGIRSSSAPPRVIEAIRHRYHLDEPLPAQYWRWFRGVATLDLGESITDRRAVMARIADKLPNTVLLNVLALLVALAVAIPAGVLSAARPHGKLDRFTGLLSFVLYSLPSFWVAVLLLELLSMRLDILPLYGITSPDYLQLSFGARFMDRVTHLILPVTTLAYVQIAVFIRFSRTVVGEVVRKPFITAARARGAGEWRLLFREALSNAMVPMISLFGLTIPFLISGSVVIERIFQWDGVGLLFFDSILARDYPMVMGLTVVTAVITLLASLVTDLLYPLVDPRIRVMET